MGREPPFSGLVADRFGADPRRPGRLVSPPGSAPCGCASGTRPGALRQRGVAGGLHVIPPVPATAARRGAPERGPAAAGQGVRQIRARERTAETDDIVLLSG